MVIRGEIKTGVYFDSVTLMIVGRDITAAPGVLDAAVFGNAIHVVVQDAAQAMPGLREALVAHKINVRRMDPIPPSLEDVFVSLTSAGRAASQEAA